MGGRGAEGPFVPSPIAVTSILVPSFHVFDFRFSYFLCNAQLDGACHQKYLGVYVT